ncbi:hypothetical protein ILYODFUR_036213 [Ilyodon furcidens]|uniref:Uncharacterized protein n=1 Tax=Ilyodon furcidens TaxID=33524 RepID=A0ABV0SSU1_9TELE
MESQYALCIMVPIFNASGNLHALLQDSAFCQMVQCFAQILIQPLSCYHKKHEVILGFYVTDQHKDVHNETWFSHSFLNKNLKHVEFIYIHPRCISALRNHLHCMSFVKCLH